MQMHWMIGLEREALVDDDELDHVAQRELERVDARAKLGWIGTCRRAIQMIAHVFLNIRNIYRFKNFKLMKKEKILLTFDPI